MLIRIGRIRLVGWSGRHFTFKAQHLSCITEGRNVLAVFALDDSVDRCGRILVRLRRSVQGLIDFVDPRRHVVIDRLFRSSNVARCFVAPADGVSKLLFVAPHRLRVSLDLATSGASPNPRPHVNAVENGRLVTPPSFKRTRKRRQLLA
jgi:hypothetical protein